MNPFLATDGYKVGHHKMYPQGTTLVYSNFTPRSNKYAPKECDKVVSFGQQMVMQQIKEMFDKDFFLVEERERFRQLGWQTLSLRDKVCSEIKREYSLYLGQDYDVKHIEALWDLGYLPIKVKTIPEGTLVPIGTPVLTIYNTKEEFFWITNFLETIISNLLWKPITSATIAHQHRKNLVNWALKTDEKNLGFVDFQAHDFSMRGLDSISATISSGLGHALSFLGSDSLPVIHGARKFYHQVGGVVHSVNATEHSVMCAGGAEDELATFRYLMKQFPTGILSIVSDTWDLWHVITNILPQLKEEILARNGKIVIRPDSGNPADILCGRDSFKKERADYGGMGLEPKHKGVVELLWDIFGGTVNEQGYKVLDPHIGAIYGDSINLERAEDILSRLETKKFASTNVVLGIGSFTYQFNTRDTFGFAMKATYVEKLEEIPESIAEYPMSFTPQIKGYAIFKDPITDDGVKKSAKGLLKVNDDLTLTDQVTWEEEGEGALVTLFQDGEFTFVESLSDIRNRLKSQD